jgi:hypothetical protein
MLLWGDQHSRAEIVLAGNERLRLVLLVGLRGVSEDRMLCGRLERVLDRVGVCCLYG